AASASHRGPRAAAEAASASHRGPRAAAEAASASNRGSRRRTPEAVVQRTSGNGAGGRAPSAPSLRSANRDSAEVWGSSCTPKEVDMIEVRRITEHGSAVFEVVIREGKGETRHHVTMSRETCERLTAGKHTPEHCLEAVSFPKIISERSGG